jgi:hypothetical protein
MATLENGVLGVVVPLLAAAVAPAPRMVEIVNPEKKAARPAA